MEVHAPHHPLNSWRDFFIHIITITIGLLIAIALEQTVEHLHNRHVRAETRENFRAEIRADEQQLPKNLHALVGERAMLEADMDLLRQVQTHHPLAAGAKLDFNWYWSSMPDAAWQTAHETGTLALFPADQVQQYSYLYGQQTLVNTAGLTLIRSITDAQIPLRIHDDLTTMSPALINELLHNCAVSLNQIDYVENLSKALPNDYKEALAEL